jgi:hypothetical protein
MRDFPDATIHAKVTTRSRKSDDGDDVRSVRSISPEEYDYIYTSFGNSYGLQRSQIDGALRSGKHHFLICNDLGTIAKLRSDYGKLALTIFVLSKGARVHLQGLLMGQGTQDSEIANSMREDELLYQQYLNRATGFDAVIVNNQGSPVSQMLDQLRVAMAARQKRNSGRDDATTTKAAPARILGPPTYTPEDIAAMVEQKLRLLLNEMLGITAVDARSSQTGNTGKGRQVRSGQSMGTGDTSGFGDDKEYDVFISARTSDRAYAQTVRQFLTRAALAVFHSDESLPRLGSADYRREISHALDHSLHMVVVVSSGENARSKWVESEWGMFIIEKRSGRKDGNIITVTAGDLEVAELPLDLRTQEVIALSPAGLIRLLQYVRPRDVRSTAKNRGD